MHTLDAGPEMQVSGPAVLFVFANCKLQPWETKIPHDGWAHRRGG